MFVRAINTMIVAVAVLIARSSQAAPLRQTDCGVYRGADNTEISRTLYEQDPGYFDRPCTSEECSARQDVTCAVEAYGALLHPPNAMNYGSERLARRLRSQLERNIQALGLEHPRRIPVYCKLLASVAGKVQGTPEDKADAAGRDWTADRLSLMAVHLDRPGNKCLAQLVAAFPQTPQVQNDVTVRYVKTCLRQVSICQRDLDPPMPGRRH